MTALFVLLIGLIVLMLALYIEDLLPGDASLKKIIRIVTILIFVVWLAWYCLPLVHGPLFVR